MTKPTDDIDNALQAWFEVQYKVWNKENRKRLGMTEDEAWYVYNDALEKWNDFEGSSNEMGHDLYRAKEAWFNVWHPLYSALKLEEAGNEPPA